MLFTDTTAVVMSSTIQLKKMDDILFTMLNASFLIAIWIAVFILVHSYISMYNEELSESRSRRLRKEINVLKQDFETLKQNLKK